MGPIIRQGISSYDLEARGDSRCADSVCGRLWFCGAHTAWVAVGIALDYRPGTSGIFCARRCDWPSRVSDLDDSLCDFARVHPMAGDPPSFVSAGLRFVHTSPDRRVLRPASARRKTFSFVVFARRCGADAVDEAAHGGGACRRRESVRARCCWWHFRSLSRYAFMDGHAKDHSFCCSHW